MTHSGSSEYQVRKSADLRAADATQRIKEKIAVLETWERDGIPEDYEWRERVDPEKKHGCPTNLSQFQKWNDSGLKIKVSIEGRKVSVEGVYAFSAVTLDKPKHSGLKERATVLLAAIKRRPTPKKEVGKLKSEKKALEALTQELVNQNAMLRAEILNMEEDFEKLNDRNVALRDRIIELEKAVDKANKVRELRPSK